MDNNNETLFLSAGTAAAIALVVMPFVLILLYYLGRALLDKYRALLDQHRALQDEAKSWAYRVLRQIIKSHASSLAAQHKRLCTTDAYGCPVTHKWKKEIKYFYNNVIIPEFYIKADEAGGDTRTKKMVNLLPLYGRPHLDPKYDHTKDPFWSDLYLKAEQYIEQAVTSPSLPSTPNVSTDAKDFTPIEFEHLCADSLRMNGWSTRIVAGSGDQGVDIVATRGTHTAVFQCKYYSKPLGNTPVQEINTGRHFYNAQTAAVVSNAPYTNGARAAAQKTGVLLLHFSELATFTID